MTQRSTAVDTYESLALAAPHWYMDASELIDVVEYYEDHGRIAEAETCLRQALQLHPNDEALRVKHAYVLRSHGQVEQADKIVRQLPKDNIDVMFYKAENALASFRIEEATQIYNRILNNDSKDSPDWQLRIEIAESYIMEGYLREAMQILSEIPGTAPVAKRAFILRSECLYSLHDTAGSIAALNHALDLDPYDVANWSMLAELQYESHHISEAQEACQYALAINAYDEKALRISYFAYAVNSQFAEALQVASTYVQHWPNEYYLPMNAGELCVTEGRMEEALEYLSRANRNCPDEHQDRIRIISVVAQVQAQQGKLDESFRTLQCACARGSQYSMVCVQMAGLAAEVGNLQYAAERLEEIVPELTSANMDLCTTTVSLMHDYPLLFMLCPKAAQALQRFNTSIS